MKSNIPLLKPRELLPAGRLRSLAGFHLKGRHFLNLCAALLVLAVGSTQSAWADSVTLTPLKDNTLFEEKDGKLSNGAGTYLFAGNTKQGDSENTRRALLQFDLSAIPPTATITNVRLTLYMSRTIDGSPRSHTLHRVLASWGEGASNAPDQEGKGTDAQTGDATWLHRFFNTIRWTQIGGDYSTTSSGSASVGTSNGDYSWSTPGMVQDVQFWLANPAANFGWLVRGAEGNLIETARQFHSRESTVSGGARRPRLQVDFIPPAQVGACCLPSGNCSITTAAECATLGGTFQGVGTSCTPNPCPPDTNGPALTVLKPNGGEVLVGEQTTNITWSATDPNGVASLDIYVSLDGGATYDRVAVGLPNTGWFAWTPADRPSPNARIRLIARDYLDNTSQDQSDSAFTIISPTVAARVPTTLRDFDLPGTQPLELNSSLATPQNCASCHGNYNPNTEPWFTWQGSMMAHASIDPLFEANLAIANQDARNSGDLCLRCHIHTGWVMGRSVPTDGRAMLNSDKVGVSCDLCHRMVDPIFDTGISPPQDAAILAAMLNPGTNFASAMVHLDFQSSRRGPFSDAVAPHEVTVSPFHREAAFCGTCHDVSNPVFERDAGGVYQPNDLDRPATDFGPHKLGVVERTYSEWLHSEFNTPAGVHLPRFAGNKPDGRVATCQDCHMRDVAGYGCDPNQHPATPLRQDLPLHDLTGHSTWLPLLLVNLYSNQVPGTAITAGVARATSMLQNAADLAIQDAGARIKVFITNNCGHKLPTGYPEGRRMWINARFYHADAALLAESAAYDPDTGVLTHDAQAKIYEVHPGIDQNITNLVGLPEGPSLHFVLNNKIFDDNRIPPRGFTNEAFAAFGGAPAGYSYEDGQYWDSTLYDVPPRATRAEVRLYFQSTSKEFIEFLRDENRTNTKGQELYDLWNNHGKCPPTLMQSATWQTPFLLEQLGFTPEGRFQMSFHCRPGEPYTIEHTDRLGDAAVWQSVSHTPTNTPTTYVDQTVSTTGNRFYRVTYAVTP